MLCPFCGYENSKVLESRTTAEKTSIRRRRECEKCQQRFTTYEKIEFAPLIMLKKNGVREKYSREKVFNSIMTACSKCGIHAEIIDEIIDKIELELLMSGKREISTYYLGDKVLEFLKELNEIAYIRYLSIFKQFQTLDELVKELNLITRQASLV